MSDKKLIENHPYVSYQKPIISDEEKLDRATSFYDKMDERRSVREF